MACRIRANEFETSSISSPSRINSFLWARETEQATPVLTRTLWMDFSPKKFQISTTETFSWITTLLRTWAYTNLILWQEPSATSLIEFWAWLHMLLTVASQVLCYPTICQPRASLCFQGDSALYQCDWSPSAVSPWGPSHWLWTPSEWCWHFNVDSLRIVFILTVDGTKKWTCILYKSLKKKTLKVGELSEKFRINHQQHPPNIAYILPEFFFRTTQQNKIPVYCWTLFHTYIKQAKKK